MLGMAHGIDSIAGNKGSGFPDTGLDWNYIPRHDAARVTSVKGLFAGDTPPAVLTSAQL